MRTTKKCEYLFLFSVRFEHNEFRSILMNFDQKKCPILVSCVIMSMFSVSFYESITYQFIMFLKKYKRLLFIAVGVADDLDAKLGRMMTRNDEEETLILLYTDLVYRKY